MLTTECVSVASLTTGLDGLTVRLLCDGRAFAGEVLAIAPREIRIACSFAVPVWTMVEVQFQHRHMQTTPFETGLLHWVQKNGNVWQLGICFANQINEQIPSLFWQDMRRELRYPLAGAATLQFGNHPRIPVQITNYSLSGIGFTSSEQIREREEFLVFSSFDATSAIVRGSINWQTALNNTEYLAGCRLAHNAGLGLAKAFCGRQPE